MEQETNIVLEEQWHPARDADSQYDPLLDSLMLVAKLYGRSVTKNSLQTGLPLVKNRLTVELFARAAGRADLSSRVLQRSLARIKDLELPAV